MLRALNLFAVGMIVLIMFGCGKKTVEPEVRKTPPVVAAPPAPPPIAPKEKQVYVYSGDRFRDPFVPSGQASAYQADATFDPQRAAVKAIVYGGQQKGAVVVVGGAGTYFVKDGHIIDVMGKRVEGFTAKVLIDKVIIQSSDDSTFELKIRSGEEDKPS